MSRWRRCDEEEGGSDRGRETVFAGDLHGAPKDFRGPGRLERRQAILPVSAERATAEHGRHTVRHNPHAREDPLLAPPPFRQHESPDAFQRRGSNSFCKRKTPLSEVIIATTLPLRGAFVLRP